MTPSFARLVLVACALSVAGCAPRPVAAPVEIAVTTPVPQDRGVPRSAAIAEAAVGRWIAVQIDGDAEAARDLRRGVLEKVLVVNPGGHVILRGVDSGRGGAPGVVSFSGFIQGRVVTFSDLPGAALLSLDGTRLVLSDPSGRSTQFVREAP